MKKVGKQVNMLKTSPLNQRNGEGSFIRLNNGHIMFGYTEFYGDTREDEECARISAIFSCDDGETWSSERVLFEKPENAVNIMSISFLRMNNGDIGAFYIEKKPDGSDKIMFTRSVDEAESWSIPVNCLEGILKNDYYILNNDRVIKLKNGRILFALARHNYLSSEELAPGKICFVFSDDDGKSWQSTSAELVCPFKNNPLGFQEPGLYEFEDGRIWCYIRTGLGFQFQAFSEDAGETWTEPEPNTFFSSPSSPMLVKKCGGLTLAIFNPVPEHILREDDEEFWGRTPYTLAVSRDDGKTFSREQLYFIEDDLNNGYCYPAVIECENHFLAAYYHSDNSDICLNATKIIKIQYSELT